MDFFSLCSDQPTQPSHPIFWRIFFHLRGGIFPHFFAALISALLLENEGSIQPQRVSYLASLSSSSGVFTFASISLYLDHFLVVDFFLCSFSTWKFLLVNGGCISPCYYHRATPCLYMEDAHCLIIVIKWLFIFLPFDFLSLTVDSFFANDDQPTWPSHPTFKAYNFYLKRRYILIICNFIPHFILVNGACLLPQYRH